MPNRRVITLLTDFGLADHFVGVMKGVILNINPDVELVDLTHEIGSYDITGSALTLAQSYSYFPPGTIHLVVVDPGVGSARRPILATTAHYNFVAPDNGVLSLVYEREAAVDVRHVTADHYWLKPVSKTFHGRDIFAPVAAWLSKGVEAANFGALIADYVKISLPRATRHADATATRVEGTVLRADKFGNLMTNLAASDVPELFAPNPPCFKIIISRREITSQHHSYAESGPSELFAILASSGFIEIAANGGSAAEILDAGPGTPVTLTLA